LRHIGDASVKRRVIAGGNMPVKNRRRVKFGDQPQDGGFANAR